MSNRREFLKKSMLLSASTAVIPVTDMFGREAAVPHRPAVTNTGDTYTVNMAHIRASERKPRQHTIPDVEGYKVLKGDFHIHTLFSDGSVMPVDRVNEAVDNGLDVIAITDHFEYRPFFSLQGKWKLTEEVGANFNLWYEEAKKEADNKNLLLVRGAEITKSVMPPGHFNALFTTDNNPIYAAVNDWREMLRVAHEQGAFLLWNHPGWEAPKSGGIERGAPLKFTKEHLEMRNKGMLNGVELFNHTEYYPVVSDWCNEYDLSIFANSDIHASELNLYGIQNPQRPMNLVLAKERSLESVKEALFARRMIACAANTLWGREPWLPALFKASVEIKTVTPGTLELTNKSSLPIQVSVGSAVIDLQKDVKRQIYRAENAKTITVANWIIGMNKPLEIALP
ncbi:MAG: PHP domain-containing protein [Tannerella sp.]|jgi:hypothetical protein|nr:PHP domain-containing protein [Tannerella sp.]